MSKINATLKKLLEIPSVSGSEYKYTEIIKSYFEQSCAEAYEDSSSNVYAVKYGKDGKRKVLIDAHFDVIGLMVGKICDDGLIKFASVGGVDTRILPAAKVVIHGKKDVSGVIGVPPPHLTSGKKKEVFKVEELAIDTGLSKKELEELVSPGDFVSFYSEYTDLLNGKIAGAGLDNKAGVYTLLEIAKRINLINTDVIFAATSGEEKNLNGARVAANSGDYDLCIIIDVTHGTTPDSEGHITFPLGGGPVLTPGPALSKKYNEILKKCAKDNDISYQLEAVTSSSGTNSTVYEIAAEGNRCVVVSIPLRYMHTVYEVVSMKDIEDTAALITMFLTEYFDKEETDA